MYIFVGDYERLFINNNIFFLLNSTLEGQTTLGRYINSHFVDLTSLKRIVMFNEYKEGSDELK